MSGDTATALEFRSPASVLAATSVAIVGASERGQWQRMIYRNLREYGYPGRVLLVNPRQQEVFGEPCFPSLRELPDRARDRAALRPVQVCDRRARAAPRPLLRLAAGRCSAVSAAAIH